MRTTGLSNLNRVAAAQGPIMTTIIILTSSILTYRPNSCTNGSLSSCIFHTSSLRHVFRRLVFFHVITDVVQPSLLVSPLHMCPCSCMVDIFFVVSSTSVPKHMVIPSQSSLSEEGCLGSMLPPLHISSFLMWSFLASSPSQHSHN